MFIKVKVKNGKILSIPKAVFENEYKPYGFEIIEDENTKKTTKIESNNKNIEVVDEILDIQKKIPKNK